MSWMIGCNRITLKAFANVSPGFALKPWVRKCSGNFSFAFKVRCHRDDGFAARCEARALPRRTGSRYLWGFAPGGIAPKLLSWTPPAGQSPRLTSGGEAVITLAR